MFSDTFANAIFVGKHGNMQKQDPKLRRTHKITVQFNDYEAEAFDRYCKRYKIVNRAKVVREAIISRVFDDIDRNYPTLFDREELEKFVHRI